MYHLSVTYLNVSLVCVAAIKMLILMYITVFCWFHHVVLFLCLLCGTDQNIVSALIFNQSIKNNGHKVGNKVPMKI